MRTSSASNRIWAGLAGLASLALVVLYAALAPPPGSPGETRPSTFFTNDSGAKAGFVVLNELFPETRRWRHEPSLLNLLADSDEAVASLIVMGPSRDLTPSQAEALDLWMTGGGQLILATDRPWPVRAPAKLWAATTSGGRPEDAPAQSPPPLDYLSRHGFKILGSEGGPADRPLFVEAGRLEAGDYTSLGGDEAGPVAGVREVGAGRLVVIADRLAFSNLRLRRHPGNMTFLVRLLENNPVAGRVAVDEFHHGFETQRPFLSLLGSFLSTAWGLAALQLGGAGLLYLLGTRARFGPVLEEAAPPVRDPLSLVEARAGLLQAAQARGLAVDLIDRHRQRRSARTAATPGGVGETPTAEYSRILQAARGGSVLRDADLPRFARMAEENTRRTH